MFNIIFQNDVLAVKKLIEERRYDDKNDIEYFYLKEFMTRNNLK